MMRRTAPDFTKWFCQPANGVYKVWRNLASEKEIQSRINTRIHVREDNSSAENGFNFAEVRKALEEMGKRKAKRKAPTKKKNLEPLDKQFNCPFCNHEKSCEVNLDKERNVGFISCRVCLEDFQTTINYLSEEVDVYSDWIDACESANQ